MATRLAGVSLWLATMHARQPAPSFTARLFVGNSLIGARFAVFLPEDFQSDDPLAKALALLVKKTEAEDIEEESARVLAAWEKQAPEGVKEVRAAVEAEMAGAGGDAEEGSDEAEEEVDEAAAKKARGVALLKVLKKQAAKLKVPRYQRRPPRPVSLEDVVTGARPKGGIYHFLLPHPDMSPFEGDKALKELAPEAIETLRAWRKEVLALPKEAELRRLEELSKVIDDRMRRAVADRQEVLERSRSSVEVWGQDPPSMPLGGWLGVAQRDKLVASARAEGSAYGQLRRVMDLWACLWAWPLSDAALMPSRKDWLAAVESVLGVEPSGVARDEQLSLSAWPPLGDDFLASSENEQSVSGTWDVVGRTRERLRPLAWEVEAPELFLLRRGVDLLVGNPPWLKVQWTERGILEEFEPRLALDGVVASEVTRRRSSVLTDSVRVVEYLDEATELQGTQAYLNSFTNYALLVTVKTNLYKCFLVRSWELGSPNAVTSLIHQDGLFDDPLGPALREEAYARLRWAFRFKNELQLFTEVDHQRPYVMTVFGARRASPEFCTMANLFHPATIDSSAAHDGAGAVRGIKSENGRFETAGHRRRVVRIGEQELALFAQLIDKPGTPPSRARLPLVHSVDALAVLRKLAAYPSRLGERPDVFGGWSSGDGRLSSWPMSSAKWDRRLAVRNSYERRWTLVELDVLAA